ncbi:MAG TPA: hypothetical protein VNN08_06935 [Thermoanaerobaculia bacterium]|nr:hypothetical protein [Thermoanaerobaculia bacterium]
MTRNSAVKLLFIATSLLTGCARLPSDFASLSPCKKVEVYVIYLHDGGAPRIRARRIIADDGLPASDAIASQLNTVNDDNDKTELVMILQEMQVRGTNLQGTRAELALRDIVAQNMSKAELRELAEGTLTIIDQRSRTSVPSTEP